MTKTIRETWLPSAGGILLPAGTSHEEDSRKTRNFAHIKGRAREIEALYSQAGVTIPKMCGLAKLIENAKVLSDRWLTNQLSEATEVDVLYALHLDRLAEALLPLSEDRDQNRYLRKMTSGELDFFKRSWSHAKDTLWELEVKEHFRKRGSNAALQDPPDVVLPLKSGDVGIACKKIYSERNVEKVLSQAVAQVEGNFDIGVVAMNLDDLLPADSVLRVRNRDDLMGSLRATCDDFLTRHDRHFRKYLSSGRLVAAWVTVSVIADVTEWQPRFNNAMDSTMWTIPGLEPSKALLMDQFRDAAIA